MTYNVRINKRLRNIKVYTIKQRIGEKETFLTKLFLKMINRKKGEQEEGPATPRGF